ncbi:hypothetical protein PQC39_gp144 [Vibrio phage Vp_R1]|uniref:Uncharacterized protein n=1 Tax=Vibrio phage Vp_R1 TaxID=2059867 RepID=A0A2H5BQ98_9CAUD|nr:hypothetical protein PQC39_gp144 [Vibrio phage Vp_R1]AUG88508.1 hypothetical protein VPR_144 [Vibrio phage Vp_R1]
MKKIHFKYSTSPPEYKLFPFKHTKYDTYLDGRPHKTGISYKELLEHYPENLWKKVFLEDMVLEYTDEYYKIFNDIVIETVYGTCDLKVRIIILHPETGFRKTARVPDVVRVTTKNDKLSTIRQISYQLNQTIKELCRDVLYSRYHDEWRDHEKEYVKESDAKERRKLAINHFERASRMWQGHSS